MGFGYVIRVIGSRISFIRVVFCKEGGGLGVSFVCFEYLDFEYSGVVGMYLF